MGVRAQCVGEDFSSLVGAFFLCTHEGEWLDPDPAGKNSSTEATKIYFQAPQTNIVNAVS